MTAPAKAAPIREDVTLLPCPFCSEDNGVSLYAPKYPIAADCDDAQVRCSNCDAVGPAMLCDMEDDDAEHHWPTARADAIAAWNTRLAHTARPDAGDDKAEIERLRGLLIDPGNPAWEDARAVLVDELRKAGLDKHADGVANADGSYIPSHIALNLIAQAARRTDADAGDEDVERVARAMYAVEDSWNDHEWEQVPPNQQALFRTQARAALAAMREGVDRGMVERDDATLREAIHKAKIKSEQVYGVAWGHLEEISRVELIIAALSPEQPR